MDFQHRCVLRIYIGSKTSNSAPLQPTNQSIPALRFVKRPSPSQVYEQGTDLVALAIDNEAIDGVADIVHQGQNLAIVKQERRHVVVLVVSHREHAIPAIAGARVLHPLVRFKLFDGSVRVRCDHNRGGACPVSDRYKAGGTAQQGYHKSEPQQLMSSWQAGCLLYRHNSSGLDFFMKLDI